jgi:hypothetical protein
MRILMKSGTTEQILCHGHVEGIDKHVGPSNLRTSGPISVQQGEFLRATYGKAYNRNNLKTMLSFSITRECASAQAAEAFCLTHLRDVLRSNTCVVQAEGSKGGKTTITISDAVLQEPVCEQIGVSVVITYTILGGAIT